MLALYGQLFAAALAGLLAPLQGIRITCDTVPVNETSVYDFAPLNIYENETVSLSKYSGRVVAIMNVATY